MIGSLMREARKDACLSMGEMAKTHKLAKPYLSRVEAGKTNISLKKASQILSVHGFDIAVMYSEGEIIAAQLVKQDRASP